MQKKNGIVKAAENRNPLFLTATLLAAYFLCGCTRQEDLLFLTETAVTEEDVSQVSGESENAGQDGVSFSTQEETASGKETKVSAEASVEAQAEQAMICVHVCGAVEIPGVYELPAGSRVYEAVQAAGGFSAAADQNYVNQAQTVTDGVKLVIPTAEEAAIASGAMAAEESGRQDFGPAKQENGTALQIGIVGENNAPDGEAVKLTDADSKTRADGRININTATKQELCAIPGVGETRAAAIISYRESHGGFTKPEDIMKVNGIKEGMYEKIKDSISVD